MLGILRGLAYIVGNGLSQALSPSGETIPFTTWVEGTFRVDPDGRYTAMLRSPLKGMAIEDIVFQ